MSRAIKAEKSIHGGDELSHAAAGNVLGPVTDSLPGQTQTPPHAALALCNRNRLFHSV